ncbi:diguanylate cyclase [Nocardioides panacisoli]|uniref:sensor domain-containing diguanylate cyclase n=1 Tax=Nocardioides panacisoli TaxID=627624 RepID=UPI001C631EDB|nr:sensor domain-containing diguanylate cyclase [Nocardioides panacisoli]QYJ03938.1 diguanylate cyclase [Nocardioides panacisoli]
MFAPESATTVDTVTVGSLALAVLYAALAPLHLLLLEGVPRVTMTLLATTSGVLCAALWWQVRRLDRARQAGTVNAFLLAMCAVPLVNSLTHMGLTGQLEQTTVLMLSVVGVAAVNPHRAQVVPLLTAATATWGVLVWATSPEPASQTMHYAIQLGLALGLGVGIALIRDRVAARLAGARGALSTQLADAVRLSEAVERSEHRFRSVFEDSPVGIGLSDEHGHFVEVNDALCALLGRPAGDLLGRSAANFTHPEDLAIQAGAGAMIEAATDGVARLEKRYIRPDGEVRWVWLTLRHVPGPQQETYTLAHVQDVTARKADEVQLRQSREAMAATAAIASASQHNADARPVALDALRSLSRSRSTMLFEPVGDGTLAITATCGDESMLGTTVDLNEPAVTTRVFANARGTFIPGAQSDPSVNQRLLHLTSAGSVMWEPVVAEGEVLAVMVVIWDESETLVTEVERQAVTMVAAELASALMAEDMRTQLEEATVTDPLTGLLNRRGWEQQVAVLRAHSQRSRQPFTVALVDLDHFKRFNDTHGHNRGDDALAHFAARAQESLRGVDAIARWGGEEFAIALRDTDADQAAAVLDRLRVTAPGELTCSIGYCEVPAGGSADDGLVAADRALYAAKGDGRDRIHRADAPARRAAGAS